MNQLIVRTLPLLLSGMLLLSYATSEGASATATSLATAEKTTATTAGQVVVNRQMEDMAVKEYRDSTADHSKFTQLQKEFDNGPEVTKACLECHTEAAKQVHKTLHWTWEYTNPKTGQKLGKKNVVNNFCTSTRSNETFCSACHIGYGWKDDSFDFSSEENVDCLVCHDTTRKYKKIPGLSGHPNYERIETPPHSGKFREATDLTLIAQNVGKTSRATCGACHFRGGGGDAVKHGDLDSSLTNPRRYLDVHMDANGLDFSCAVCHLTDSHEVSGSRYAPTAADSGAMIVRGNKGGDRNPTTCQACHGTKPHGEEAAAKLNDHTDRIACQSCHIPTFARGNKPTKMSWNWETAGRLDENSKRIRIRNSGGQIGYDSKKGDFTYESHVIPKYRWFDGNIKYTLFGDEIDPTKMVEINKFMGSADDPDSRIWPVKEFTGRQPIDVEKKTLAIFHTAGDDDSAFWGNYDWDKALTVGMKAAGAEYSGEMAFVDTKMSWPITHMVAPKEDALSCKQCHQKGGRMDEIDGIYMPGRDAIEWMDTMGFGVAFLALLGVLGHGGGRIYMHYRLHGRKEDEQDSSTDSSEKQE